MISNGFDSLHELDKKQAVEKSEFQRRRQVGP